MSKVDENLSTFLNTQFIENEPQEEKNAIVVQKQNTEQDNDVLDDADYARRNLYSLIEKGNDTIENISDIARESMHPRAFEVLGQLMKTQSENLDKLLKLQKDKKDLLKKQDAAVGDNPASPSISVDKAVFIGSTAELLKRLKNENI
jgi:hypothetical protein